jgi:hypothetical protein
MIEVICHIVIDRKESHIGKEIGEIGLHPGVEISTEDLLKRRMEIKGAGGTIKVIVIEDQLVDSSMQIKTTFLIQVKRSAEHGSAITVTEVIGAHIDTARIIQM